MPTIHPYMMKYVKTQKPKADYEDVNAIGDKFLDLNMLAGGLNKIGKMMNENAEEAKKMLEERNEQIKEQERSRKERNIEVAIEAEGSKMMMGFSQRADYENILPEYKNLRQEAIDTYRKEYSNDKVFNSLLAKFDFDVSSLYHTKRRESHVTDFNNRIKQHHGAIKSGNADARNKAAIMGQTDIDIQQKAGFLTEQEANQHRYYMAKMQDYFDALETATAGRTPGEAALYVYNNELPGLDHDDRDKMFKSPLLDQTIMDENFKNSKMQSQKAILQGLAGEKGLFLKPGDITNLYLEIEGPGSREFFGELFADRRTAKIDGTVSKYDTDEPGAFVSLAGRAISGEMEWDEIMGKVGDGVSIGTANTLSQLSNTAQNMPSRQKNLASNILNDLFARNEYSDGMYFSADKEESYRQQLDLANEFTGFILNNPDASLNKTKEFYNDLIEDSTLVNVERFIEDFNNIMMVKSQQKIT